MPKQQATAGHLAKWHAVDKHDPAPSITTDENHATALSGTTGAMAQHPMAQRGEMPFLLM
jgi:hypothetical protein